jgi:hypothetical protein
MSRDWVAFREKVDREGNRCRVCRQTPADAAHIIPRSRIGPGPAEDPRNCVPLCRIHHRLYDDGGGALDLLPYLDRREQAYAVELVGLEEARRRLTGER